LIKDYGSNNLSKQDFLEGYMSGKFLSKGIILKKKAFTGSYNDVIIWLKEQQVKFYFKKATEKFYFTSEDDAVLFMVRWVNG